MAKSGPLTYVQLTTGFGDGLQAKNGFYPFKQLEKKRKEDYFVT